MNFSKTTRAIVFGLLVCLTLVIFTSPVQGTSGKSIPLTFSIDYTLVSDYVWRGQNLSDYSGEGGDRPNHQTTVGISYDAGNWGEFSGSVWFEWFPGQRAMDPDSNGHLQEVDYTLSWSYNVEPLATIVELGWIGYQFPQASDDGRFTHEWYVSLAFDDSKLFGTKEPILNPYVAYYRDMDDLHGGWLEFGISHDFVLANYNCSRTPILKDITVTPSFVMGVDQGQVSSSTRMANLQYGLDVAYDLSAALGMDEKYGSFTLTGFLRFSDAVYNEALDDQFWGGVSIGYQW